MTGVQTCALPISAQLGRSFRESVLVSVVAAELAVVVGVGLSYTYGLAAGGTIVLVAIGGYGLAVATQYATSEQ